MIDRYFTDVTQKDKIYHYVYIDLLKYATFCTSEGNKIELILRLSKLYNVYHLCTTKNINCFYDNHNY